MSEEKVIKLIQSSNIEDRLIGVNYIWREVCKKHIYNFERFLKVHWGYHEDTWEIYIGDEVNVVNFSRLGVHVYGGNSSPSKHSKIYKI